MRKKEIQMINAALQFKKQHTMNEPEIKKSVQQMLDEAYDLGVGQALDVVKFHYSYAHPQIQGVLDSISEKLKALKKKP